MSRMDVAQSLYRPWDDENDKFLLDELKRRAAGLGKAANAKKVVTADPRGIFGAVSSLLISTALRIEALIDTCRELHLQRDELTTALRKRDRQWAEERRGTDAEIRELRLELRSVKTNESLLWTEVLELRKLKASPGSIGPGPRVYFEE